MCPRLVPVLALATLGVSVHACGLEREGNVSKLLSKTSLDRQAGFNAILAQRQQTIKELVAILRQDSLDISFNGSLHRAIVLLGKLRAVEAIDWLSVLLLYVPAGFEADEMIESERYYVAAVALSEIGLPSVAPMLEKIRHADSVRERNLAAWVIMEVEGKEQALNRLGLGSTLRQDEGGRVKAARTYIRHYEPTFGNPLGGGWPAQFRWLKGSGNLERPEKYGTLAGVPQKEDTPLLSGGLPRSYVVIALGAGLAILSATVWFFLRRRGSGVGVQRP